MVDQPERRWAMNAREEVLARIRHAIGDTTAEVVTRQYRDAETEHDNAIDLVDLLVDRLMDYKASVSRCTAEGIPAAVAAAVGDRDGTIVIPSGLDRDFVQESRVLIDENLSPDELDATAGVVTGAAVAIADTGTIVLDAAPDQGRRAITLVPDLHICVLFEDHIVYSVPEAIAALTPERPLTMISGPSATSDIELSRVEGVHGPRTLHVIIASR
jgi:L-lactate dehydrogenase complex protein LldG